MSVPDNSGQGFLTLLLSELRPRKSSVPAEAAGGAVAVVVYADILEISLVLCANTKLSTQGANLANQRTS